MNDHPSTYPLHIYHTRNKHQIFYFSEGNEVYNTGENSVYFQAPLNEYNYSLSQVGLSEKEHYTFEGWYADEGGNTPFDFSGTMPNGNVTVYAKWSPNWYQIIVDPEKMEKLGIAVRSFPICEPGRYIRHNSADLAAAIMQVWQEFRSRAKGE